jgi:hypothetical protein
LDYYPFSRSIRKIAFLCVLFILLGNFSCERQNKKEPKSETNSPPVITSANILPEKPNKES